MSVRVASKVHGVVFTPLLYSNGDVQAWNGYSAQEQDWIIDSRKVFEASPDAMEDSFQNSIDQVAPVTPYIFGYPHGAPVTTLSLDGTPVAPWWQQSPPPYDAATKVNANVLADLEVKTLYQAMVQAREAIFGPVSTLDLFSQGFAKTATETKRRDGDQLYGDDSFLKAHGEDSGGHRRALDEDRYHPMSLFMQPVFADLFDTSSPLVGVLHAAVPWDSYVVNLLPQGVNGIRVVMRNDCGEPHTYQVDGPNVSNAPHKALSTWIFVCCLLGAPLLTLVLIFGRRRPCTLDEENSGPSSTRTNTFESTCLFTNFASLKPLRISKVIVPTAFLFTRRYVHCKRICRYFKQRDQR